MFKKNILFSIISLCTLTFVNAQFVINDNFRNKTTTSKIAFGGTAELTAGKIDPEGDGWLRITPAISSSKGYAFIDEAFPSTFGLIAEFEFKAWRSTERSEYTGGDGFSVFLFDGSVEAENFRLGGYGSSLGYARNSATNPVVPNGLFGGYIGIGFDSFGNFGNTGEGKSGLLSNNNSIPKDANVADGSIPNTIVLRGATNEDNSSLSNKILSYYKLGNRNVNASNMRKIGELDYDVLTDTRPTDDQFYRKIKIIIKPITESNVPYKIDIYMSTNIQDVYSSTPIISYTTEQDMPSTLKIGFAASTGGAYNNHEIRNLRITTTGNLSVFNTVDVPLVCEENQTQIENFRIDINNLNSAELKKIKVDSKFLKEANGSLLNKDDFEINSLSFSSNIKNNNLTYNSNTITGSIGLDAESTGTIFVNATIKKPNTQVVNTVEVSSSDLEDQDLNNNISTVSVNRHICKVPTNPMLFIKAK